MDNATVSGWSSASSDAVAGLEPTHAFDNAYPPVCEDPKGDVVDLVRNPFPVGHVEPPDRRSDIESR